MKYPMHLLIEGVDGVGKSTVCELLSKRLAMPITRMPEAHFFFNASNKRAIEDAACFYNMTLLNFAPLSFIMDRGYVTSLVYSAVYRRDNDLSYTTLIEEALQPYVFVLINSDLKALEGRKVDEVIHVSDISRIQAEYLRLATFRGYQVVETKGLSPDQVADRICTYLSNID